MTPEREAVYRKLLGPEGNLTWHFTNALGEHVCEFCTAFWDDPQHKRRNDDSDEPCEIGAIKEVLAALDAERAEVARLRDVVRDLAHATGRHTPGCFTCKQAMKRHADMIRAAALAGPTP